MHTIATFSGYGQRASTSQSSTPVQRSNPSLKKSCCSNLQNNTDHGDLNELCVSGVQVWLSGRRARSRPPVQQSTSAALRSPDRQIYFGEKQIVKRQENFEGEAPAGRFQGDHLLSLSFLGEPDGGSHFPCREDWLFDDKSYVKKIGRHRNEIPIFGERSLRKTNHRDTEVAESALSVISISRGDYLETVEAGCSARIFPVRIKSRVWFRSRSLAAARTSPPDSFTALNLAASISNAMK